MESKIFDIPFRTRSLAGDFSCTDGEIGASSGVIFTDSDSTYADSSSDSVQDFLSETTIPQPPSPEISFALLRDSLAGWQIHPDAYPVKTLSCNNPSADNWGKIAKSLPAQFMADAMLQNLFTSPFFVMAAWRMKSGAYISPSSPLLMIPNSESPIVSSEGSIEASQLDLRVVSGVCRLAWKLSLPETLREWVGKIDSLEIMVSRQQQLYNPSKNFLFGKNIKSSNTTFSLDPSTGLITEQPVCTEIQPIAWQPVKADGTVADSTLSSLDTFFTIASFPLGALIPVTGFTSLQLNCGSLAYVYENAPTLKNISAKSSAKAGVSSVIVATGDFTLTTRPIKLSCAGSFKILKKIFIRGNINPKEVGVTVTGSHDMRHWYAIGSRHQGSSLFLNPIKSRFFKISIEGNLTQPAILEGVSLLVNY